MSAATVKEKAAKLGLTEETAYAVEILRAAVRSQMMDRWDREDIAMGVMLVMADLFMAGPEVMYRAFAETGMEPESSVAARKGWASNVVAVIEAVYDSGLDEAVEVARERLGGLP